MTNPRLRVVPAGQARRGFSLVELLVVIAIIAIVLAIVVPSLGGVRTAAKVSASRLLMADVNSAATSFATDERRLPGYFTAAQMGSPDNAARGFSAMENVLLDLAGGVQRSGAGAGSITSGWIRVGPTKILAESAWIDPNQIGSSNKGGKAYFIPPAKNFVLQTATPQQKVAKSSPATEDFYKLPDLVDAFGTPLLAWVENEAASQSVSTIDDFAQLDSSSASKPPAKFYWNSNAAFLQATALGKQSKNQAEDSLLSAKGGTYPGGGPLGPQDKPKVLAGFLGNMGFPNTSTAGPDMVPAASRGKFIIHSAGPDGTYLHKYDVKGKGFGGPMIKYGYYFSGKGDPSQSPYLDSAGKSQPVDFIAKFDDLLQVGGS